VGNGGKKLRCLNSISPRLNVIDLFFYVLRRPEVRVSIVSILFCQFFVSLGHTLLEISFLYAVKMLAQRLTDDFATIFLCSADKLGNFLQQIVR